jgi:hypothetical protein
VFSIQKGLVGVDYANTPYAVNEPMAPDERRIPLANMIYVGDGPSDIPCMSLLEQSEGHVIGILSKDIPDKTWALGFGRRAHITVPPDFREGEHAFLQLREALHYKAEMIARDFEYRRSRRVGPKF